MDWKRTGFQVLYLSLLSTYVLAEITIRNLDDQQVHEGDTVILNCILKDMRESDSVVIFWYRGNSVVSFNDDLAVVNSRYMLDTSISGQWKLTIQQAGIEDQGLWRCQLQIPNHVSEEMSLTVLTPPAITGITQNLTPMTGSTVALWCNATGSPQPTITWQRLRPERRFPSPPGGAYSTGSMFLISDIDSAWRGLYQCSATNGIGQESITGHVFLQMEYSPIVKADKGVVSAPRGRSASLVCICQAYPAIVNINQVMWLKDNNQVDVSDGYQMRIDLDEEGDPYRETSVSTLVVNSVRDDTIGDYTCRFENAEAKVALGVGVVVDPDIGKPTSKASTVVAATVINAVFIAIATALAQF